MNRLAAGPSIHEAQGRELPRLRLARRTYPPLHRMPPHAHSETGLSFVMDGAVEESAGGETRLSCAGGLVIKPADVTHSDRFGPRGATLLAVAFKPAFFDACADAEPFFSGLKRYVWRHDAAAIRAGAALRRMFQGLGLQTEDEIETALFDLLEVLGAGRGVVCSWSSPPAWFGRVRERLHAEYARPPGARELAAEAGVHPIHLARVFRRQLRCTISEYVRRLRVLAAAERLATSDEPPARIAGDLGFADQAHFCRVFKTQLGATPLEYRGTHLRNVPRASNP